MKTHLVGLVLWVAALPVAGCSLISTLPLAAIPGWDLRNHDPEFIASAECFRPKPAGRVYAPPLRL